MDQGSGGYAPCKRAERRVGALVSAASVGVLVVASSAPAAAQEAEKPTLAGTWSATALSETWSTSEWGDACGPKPTSGGGAPAGTVTVTDQGGELAFSGAGRAFSTAQCWEPTPGLKRTSHSGGKRGWSSTCASAASDPRRATVTTRFSATDDTIVFSETGVFEFAIMGATCKASVSRSRSFKLKQRAGSAEPAASAPPAPPTAAPAAPSAAPPAPPPPEPEGCDDRAAPARIEVRPARKLLRPGERFELDVRVLDQRTCRLQAKPELALREGSSLAPYVDLDGRTVSVHDDAPEGQAEVVVSLGGKSVTVTLEVTPAAKYAELLAARGLDARGEDPSARVVEIESGLGSPQTEGLDTARARRITFLAIVGGVAALLGIVALALLRRGRRAQVRSAPEAPAPPPNVTFFKASEAISVECPRCGLVLAPGAGFCPKDGSALAPSKRAPPAPSEPPPAAGAAPARKKPRREPEKICPTCGETFASDAGFCGKDGTQLVPIN